MDLAIIIPTVTAIVAGLAGFLTSAYVGYLNNQGSLVVEREKERANLILEAVKTGDRKKALENLTFFIDAGFLDDPGGKIKALISHDVIPVLPTGKNAFEDALAALQKAGTGAHTIIELGDKAVTEGKIDDAIKHYQFALVLLDPTDPNQATDISNVKAKISKLKGTMGIK